MKAGDLVLIKGVSTVYKLLEVNHLIAKVEAVGVKNSVAFDVTKFQLVLFTQD